MSSKVSFFSTGSSALKRLGVTEEMLSKVANDQAVVDRLQSIMSGVGTNDVKVWLLGLALLRRTSPIVIDLSWGQRPRRNLASIKLPGCVIAYCRRLTASSSRWRPT